MPLGFGRSVFTHKAAGGALAEFYTFRDDTAVGDANKATYVLTHSTGPFANNLAFSYVLWFRVNGTANIPASGAYPMLTQISKSTSPNANNGSNVQIESGSSSSFLQVNLYNNHRNIILRSNSASGPYSTGTDFRAGVLDGNWHCLMCSIVMNSTSGRYMYIDGVDVMNDLSSTSTSTTTLNMDTYKYIKMRMDRQVNDTTFSTNGNFGAEADVGPIWYYDTAIDFSDSAVRAYYYNASNTDGFVDGGTDGTAGGAATPKLYFYTNASGGQISSSGTSPAVATSTLGSGVISIYQEGAGTGDTY